MKKRIDLISGARPNLVKIAPLLRKFESDAKLEVRFVHTNQHYDDLLYKRVLKSLRVREPDVIFKPISTTGSLQISHMINSYDVLLQQSSPDLCIVVGDVNATLACSLGASFHGVPLAHVEAGLRSFDRSMPEEINRIVVDHLADYLFTTSDFANHNLIREGIANERIFFVGNLMIDSLEYHRTEITSSKLYQELGLLKKNYIVATFHRPGNVDSDLKLNMILEKLMEISKLMRIYIPTHPRLFQRLDQLGLLSKIKEFNITLSDPLNYIDFVSLVYNARLIITDSGGLQEESTHLRIPCLTFRENTERPETIKSGLNSLVNSKSILGAVKEKLEDKGNEHKHIEKWDGMTSERITKHIYDLLGV